ncbi:OmpA family protein [Alteromonas sp. A081]|uniref:OmpA family protein n=1 Tax=Alteromonas sp. A081 TaxID=3410269 RepID=UPI003B987B36
MASNPTHTTPADDDHPMDELRKIILGESGEHITTVMRANAREVVSDVLVEAIHDRQATDDRFNQVLTPLVSKSVETAVKRNSEEFVSYIYPLVGRLVRKSVTAFLREFLDKTNELLENSLTLKGLVWRYKAWHSGISFSEYVISQTFAYRVEQILLIHSETGILLNSVALDSGATDSDLMSAMLTAINDFVTDSFQQPDLHDENAQHLEVIKTAGLTLVIKRGPKLLLVATVKGSIPQALSNKFEQINESVHHLFSNEITHFSGDVASFESTSQLLREGLIAQQRGEASKHNKKPYLAIILLVLVAGLLLAWAINSYQHNEFLDRIRTLDKEPGIIVHEIKKTGWRAINLSVLRDPNATSIVSWLKAKGIDTQLVNVTEKPYLSLEDELVLSRIRRVTERYSGISIMDDDYRLALRGSLSQVNRLALSRELLAVPGVPDINTLLAGVNTTMEQGLRDDSPEVLKAMFDSNAAKINRTEIQFEPGESALTESVRVQLDTLAGQIKAAIQLSQQLKINIGIIIMGASDSSGSAVFNQKLSKQRADSVREYLARRSVEPAFLHAIGLGVIEMKSSGAGIRKVIFSVIEIDSEQTQGQQDQ